MTIEEMLIRDEGLELKLYKDTKGKWTIGVGRNLSDNGITKAEALYLLHNDIERHRKELEKKFSWFKTLNPVRKKVIVNMAFNLGVPRFSQFKKMIAAIKKQDWKEAAKQMIDSKWSKQVGDRSIRLAGLMERGKETT